MHRKFSVPLITKTKSLQSKNQNIQQKLISFKRYDKDNVLKKSTSKNKLPSQPNQFKNQKQHHRFSSQSHAVKKLRNFIKRDQTPQSYVKQFVHLRKSSFFLNNRLTKSVYDINDAAMIGKPQPLNTFRSMKNYAGQTNISSLKNAVKNITKQSKSHIPRLYQKSLSLSNFSKTDDLNLSAIKNKSFFPTTALQNTDSFIQQFKQKKNVKAQSLSIKQKLNKFQNKKAQQLNLLAKPLSQRKIIKIDYKITQLKQHNLSMHKLIPLPITKHQKIIIKGKGQIISQDKIIRVIDKLLSLLQLYFQMHDQNGTRVYAFVKNIEGFQNKKILEVLCDGEECIKRIRNSNQLKSFFWVFKSQKLVENENDQNKKIKLPEFFGEQDYSLYKLLNNFALKLESKYENHHKQKYKKLREIEVKKQSSEFSNLQLGTNQSSQSHMAKNYNSNKQYRGDKGKSILLISQNKHTDRRIFLQKIKFNPISNDKKISNQIQELQDLGVKFDFKQKGKSIILSQRSKIIFSKR